MTDEKLFEVLSGILAKVSEEEYPEICEILHSCLDLDEKIVYGFKESIANQLFHADETKVLPACVAEFLMRSYQEQLKQGSADAACNIGALYYTGRAGEQNYKKAVAYYTLAANGGCSQAQENLGYCYYYGRDIPVDYEKAFHYFALGAFDNNLRSLYKIGDMYRNGYYVPKNEVEAFRIYDRCANSLTAELIPVVGADLMMRMGDCYFSGIGTDPDYKKALGYYQQAEHLFFDRLENGDFMIRKCYDRVITRQSEIRKKLESTLPSFEWTRQK